MIWMKEDVPVEINSMSAQSNRASVLAPEAVVRPGVGVSIHIHNRNNDELGIMQNLSNVVILLVIASKVVREVLD